MLDTAEALGFGLIALTAYAVVRGRSEREGAAEAARLAGAYAAGFVGALAAGVLLRHAVYEQTIALTHPTLSGYVLTNALEQVGARGAEGATFMAQGLGVAGTAYFLAWIWGQLTRSSRPGRPWSCTWRHTSQSPRTWPAMRAQHGAGEAGADRGARVSRWRWPSEGWWRRWCRGTMIGSGSDAPRSFSRRPAGWPQRRT